jgi:hypothetical protein
MTTVKCRMLYEAMLDRYSDVAITANKWLRKVTRSRYLETIFTLKMASIK